MLSGFSPSLTSFLCVSDIRCLCGRAASHPLVLLVCGKRPPAAPGLTCCRSGYSQPQLPSPGKGWPTRLGTDTCSRYQLTMARRAGWCCLKTSLSFYPKELRTRPHKILPVDIHSTFTHGFQNWEATEMFFRRLVGK